MKRKRAPAMSTSWRNCKLCNKHLGAYLPGTSFEANLNPYVVWCFFQWRAPPPIIGRMQFRISRVKEGNGSSSASTMLCFMHEQGDGHKSLRPYRNVKYKFEKMTTNQTKFRDWASCRRAHSKRVQRKESKIFIWSF